MTVASPIQPDVFLLVGAYGLEITNVHFIDYFSLNTMSHPFT